MRALERVHESLMTCGWAVATAAALGLPPETGVVAALSPALVPDQHGPGKLHARDVITYDRPSGECSPAADGTGDCPRFRLLDGPARLAATRILGLVPPPMRRDTGRLSADYFRYTPGSGAGPHQDAFGDLVAVWVLDRDGNGAESFLTTLDGRDVMRGVVPAGDLLVFRDEMFLHGVGPLETGHRDALVFITLREP